MPNWEYKAISSGKGGFASPALLEKFLNDLGREEWEIIEFRTLPDNPLAFTGLARRSTQRDWTLEDAAAAAAKAEAEKLRAEFEAKFKAASSNAPTGPVEDAAATFLDEKAAPEDGFRKPIDTSRDSDPDAPETDDEEKDEWDKLAEEDELPTFFEALKPHMRRNQRGPGMSVGVDYLAKKWGLDESDIKGALVECGLQIPADENAKPVHVEYDGDLFWVNINRRGEMWINTREKPRPVFRVVQANKVASETIEETKPEHQEQKTEAVRHQKKQQNARQPEAPAPSGDKADAPAQPAADTPAEPLPNGPEILTKIRPHMRRNRRGPGGSGSLSFLSRALKCSEADLLARFSELGLIVAENDKPVNVEIGGQVWWLNKDSRGGVWINGRDKRDGETIAPAAATETPAAPVTTESAPAPESGQAEIPAVADTTADAARKEAAPAETASSEAAPADPNSPLTAVRLLLKETKTGGVAAKLDRLAEELGKSADELLGVLTAAGLKVPEKAREKPVFVPHGSEILWLNKNAKGELWLNAKESKFAESGEDGGARKSRRPRRSKKGDAAAAESPAEPAPASE
ncbi:MAG: hypothetical protein NVV63_06110 [Opitutus sp.]|nr:hypothetical protein [Opitutus sp.]